MDVDGSKFVVDSGETKGSNFSPESMPLDTRFSRSRWIVFTERFFKWHVFNLLPCSIPVTR